MTVDELTLIIQDIFTSHGIKRADVNILMLEIGQITMYNVKEVIAEFSAGNIVIFLLKFLFIKHKMYSMLVSVSLQSMTTCPAAACSCFQE